MREMTILINVGREVVGTTFLRIEGEVQDVETGCTGVGVLRLLRIELAFIDFTYIVVGELIQVALDMSWGERAAAARENGVDIVPGQQCTVVAVCSIPCHLALGKHAWRT